MSDKETFMRRLIYRRLVIVVAALLGGCNSSFDPNPLDPWVEREPASWQLQEEATVHTRQTLLGTFPDAAGAALDPDAGVEDYVRLALERHPAIRAAEHKVRRLTQRIAQAQSLDDPMLRIGAGEMAQTAAGQAEVMTSVSQKLPLPDKLATRGRIASQAAAIASAELAALRLEVAADTRRAFWSYYFAARGMEVLTEDHTLLTQFKQIAESKYKAGTASQQDVLRASVELSNLANERLKLEQQQASARSMLNRQLDRPVNADLPKPKAVELQNIALQINRLLVAAASANPELHEIHERIEEFRQRLKLARLNRWPDLTVSFNYTAIENGGLAPSETGDDQWWLGLGVNVPIWTQKLDAAEHEARAGIFEAVADLTSRHNSVAFRVHDALVKVETQQRMVLLFRDVIIPQAQQTVEVSQSSYRAGKIDFLTIVDNWRKLLDFKMMYHHSLAQFEQDFAQLQQDVGRDLERQPTGVQHRGELQPEITP
jgi:cobalt-zinc-cadmium efflux system outer membrane protein